MARIHACVATVAVLSLPACYSTGVTRIGAPFPARPPGSQVEVFQFEDQVERPFIRIGRVTADAAALASRRSVDSRVLDRARELGADALIVETTAPASLLSTARDVYVAIRYVNGDGN